ncbi:MAG: ABC transporter substrate-binding protein [Sedimentibacter sp.]
MKINIKIILAFIFLFALTGCKMDKTSIETNTHTVLDMAGRSVEIPNNITKVYATGQIGSIMLYTLAPEKICGWNNTLSDTEIIYIDEKYHELPNLGSWKGTKYSGNIEELLSIKPDLIINMGDVSETYISDSEEIEKQTGIPVLMIDGSIEKTAEVYNFLGAVLNKEERASDLSDYFNIAINDVKSAVEKIQDDEKARVYYAEGLDGLETELQGSINSEILDICGAVNIAKGETVGSSRRIQVSLEQVLLENPDVIIISSDGDKSHQTYNKIVSNSIWANIKAVEYNKVYEIPSIPYDWINRPPSVNRIIGIKWLANLLYPEKYEINIDEEIKNFFELYYSYEITDSEIDEILMNSK